MKNKFKLLNIFLLSTFSFEDSKENPEIENEHIKNNKYFLFIFIYIKL